MPWERLGDWDVELLEVYRVEPGGKVADGRVVKDAIAMAVKHATGASEWARPRYYTGPRAFDEWAAALEAGTASIDGHTYNAQVWHECRAMAVEFLAEAKQRLPRLAAACDRAASHYCVVRDRLTDMIALHPPRQDADWVTAFVSSEAASLARQAAAAERLALSALSEIPRAL